MYDKQIVGLFKLIYGLSTEEENELMDILIWLAEEDKKYLVLILWKRYKKEKWAFNSLFTKLKFIRYKVKDLKDKKEADSILDKLD